MQLYWKCDECDEVNAYPDVKICETCGSPMTPAAEQRVLHAIREEKERKEQIKKEEERRRQEEQRAKLEEERKRKEAEAAALRAERERKRMKALEEKLKKKAAKEKIIAGIYRNTSLLVCRILQVLVAIAIAFSVFLFIDNAEDVNLKSSIEGVRDNIISEVPAHVIINKNGEKSSRVVNNLAEPFPSVFVEVYYNAKEQFVDLCGSFTPIKNISILFNGVVDYLKEEF